MTVTAPKSPEHRARELERDKMAEANAADLLEHGGYTDMLRDIIKEAKAARAVLLGLEDLGEVRQAHARGSLAVLRDIVLGVYQRANKTPPPNIAALFE